MLKRIFLIGMLVAIIALPVLASTGGAKDSSGIDLMVGLGVVALGTVMSPGTLISLQKSFQAIFNEAQAAMPPVWPDFAMEVTSTGAGEDYQWLADTPAMREWLGEKFLKELLGFNYYLPNKDWEATLKVFRKDIDDDKLGKYAPKIRQLAEEGNIHMDALMTALRVAATATACYDGKMFYATNHVTNKSGTQSNLLTGTGKTVALVSADFNSARAALRKFKTDQNKPFIRQAGKLKLQVTTPPGLEGVFEQIANSSLINGSDNQLKGAFTYKVDANLADDDDWYLDYVGSSIRPFVMQMRERPHLVAQENPNSDTVFLRAVYLYSVEARYNAGFGLWPYSIKVTNA